MVTLTEHKNSRQHYFIDEQGRKQGTYTRWRANGKLHMQELYIDGRLCGEYKEWWQNGNIREHGICKDFYWNGECKRWKSDGSLIDHAFFCDGEDIINDINPLVEDIINLTQEERIMIKLKFGVDTLC